MGKIKEGKNNKTNGTCMDKNQLYKKKLFLRIKDKRLHYFVLHIERACTISTAYSNLELSTLFFS